MSDVAHDSAPPAEPRSEEELERIRMEKHTRFMEGQERRKAERAAKRPWKTSDDMLNQHIADFFGDLAKLSGELSAEMHSDEAQTAWPKDRVLAKQGIEILVTKLGDMRAVVAEASHFLPKRHLTMGAQMCDRAEAAIDQVRQAVLPRKRFRFSKRTKRGAKSNEPDDTTTTTTITITTATETAAAPSEEEAPSLDPRFSLADEFGKAFSRTHDEIAGHDFDLVRLQNCTVFLLGTLTALRCDGLLNCTVVTGAIPGAVLLENCTNCTLVVRCRQLRVSYSHNMTISAHVQSLPALDRSTGAVMLPYHFSFPGSDAQAKDAGFDNEINMWDQVNDFTWLRTTPSPNWRVATDEEMAPVLALQAPE